MTEAGTTLYLMEHPSLMLWLLGSALFTGGFVAYCNTGTSLVVGMLGFLAFMCGGFMLFPGVMCLLAGACR